MVLYAARTARPRIRADAAWAMRTYAIDPPSVFRSRRARLRAPRQYGFEYVVVVRFCTLPFGSVVVVVIVVVVGAVGSTATGTGLVSELYEKHPVPMKQVAIDEKTIIDNARRFMLILPLIMQLEAARARQQFQLAMIKRSNRCAIGGFGPAQSKRPVIHPPGAPPETAPAGIEKLFPNSTVLRLQIPSLGANLWHQPSGIGSDPGPG